MSRSIIGDVAACCVSCRRNVHGSIAVVRAQKGVSVEAVESCLHIVVTVARNAGLCVCPSCRNDAVVAVEVTSPHAVVVLVLNVAVFASTFACVVVS